MNIIREMIFNRKLIDIEAFQIECWLNIFLIKFEWWWLFHWRTSRYSKINLLDPRAEETIKKAYNRVLRTSEKLYIYKQVISKNSNKRNSIWLPTFRNCNKIYCKVNRGSTFEYDKPGIKYKYNFNDFFIN